MFLLLDGNYVTKTLGRIAKQYAKCKSGVKNT